MSYIYIRGLHTKAHILDVLEKARKTALGLGALSQEGLFSGKFRNQNAVESGSYHLTGNLRQAP